MSSDMEKVNDQQKTIHYVNEIKLEHILICVGENFLLRKQL